MLKMSQFETEKNFPQHVMSQDDAKKADFVKKRYQEMKQARTIIDKDRQTYQDMIDAIFQDYPDERTSSVVPLASSLIELYVADAMKIQTEYKFRGETSKY